jgi:RimJ/RimL family protein N-acetyltransferase
MRTGMKLLPYSTGDLALTVALEVDAAVMQELGGPIHPEQLTGVHEKRLAGMDRGDWYFTIVPDGFTRPAGIVAIYETEWEGATIHEIGLMILPDYQRLGVATEAAEMILALARAAKRFPGIHAFPAVTNGPSNALCRNFGFTNLGECNLEYEGRPLRCNHWLLEL